MKSEIAYCGLYCSDCIIRQGRLAYLANELLNRMHTVEFQALSKGLIEIQPDIFKSLKDCDTCRVVLAAMRELDCEKPCREMVEEKPARSR